ncbi:MAG TPA: amidohydrolase [Bacteroidales bacterium]|nr:amidohydrolase [Bacteroidales bacterium]
MKQLSFIALVATVLFLGSCRPKQEADLIIYNAVIYTVDSAFSIQESMAIKDGKILAVGTNREIERSFRSVKTKNLYGAFVYPGFMDPHSHFIGFGRYLETANLMGVTTFEEIVSILRQHHATNPREWVIGRGWDQNLWPVREFPNKSLLDIAFPDVPVLLIRIDGHAAIANSEALRRAGITSQTRVPGGKILLQNGQPTGMLIDKAIDLVRQQIPPRTINDDIRALMRAQSLAFAAGLTSVSEAGIDYQDIRLIDSLQSAGKLKIRVYAMINPTEDNFEGFMRRGQYKTDLLNVRSVKLFTDGALGSRGAKLLEPYSDDPSNSGLLLNTPEFLRIVSKEAHKFGFQVNTHCIGDSAVRLMLHIYRDILKERNDLRWRIEHAQVVHPDDFNLFGQYSIIPSIQTSHATSDMIWAIDRLGPERIKTAYAYRQLLEQNGWLPNGSDFPVERINPLYGFYAAFERRNHQGLPLEGFQMDNALTRKQALKGMTIWSAKAQFEENEKGSLEPGKFADFVVLEKDIMEIPAAEILTLPIQYTFVNGEIAFEIVSAPTP